MRCGVGSVIYCEMWGRKPRKLCLCSKVFKCIANYFSALKPRKGKAFLSVALVLFLIFEYNYQVIVIIAYIVVFLKNLLRF